MRWMIDWMVGIEKSVLDVAIDGLVAILGASFLTLVLHVIIGGLQFFELRFSVLRFCRSSWLSPRGDRKDTIRCSASS